MLPQLKLISPDYILIHYFSQNNHAYSFYFLELNSIFALSLHMQLSPFSLLFCLTTSAFPSCSDPPHSFPGCPVLHLSIVQVKIYKITIVQADELKLFVNLKKGKEGNLNA